ncbi:hypothetical protein ACFYUY_04690 [Kitasatospora sp. NPDC004745]|uniref:hypothetical protein n=1 Tax=Kitasatospora sp. NPDC004745 TaxID=3364019 RepID=UPI00369CACAE
MKLAPLPDHNLVTDPAWKDAFHAYHHVIAPLRRRGLITDMEMCGGEKLITAELPDRTVLMVGTDTALPTDPLDVKGWNVSRHSDDNPTIADIVYDSTLTGADWAQRQLLSPLFAAIDAYLGARDLLPRQRVTQPIAVLRSQVTNTEGVVLYPADRYFIDRRLAVGAYTQAHDMLAENGWARIYAHPSRQWPTSTWLRADMMLRLGVAESEFTTSDRGHVRG